MDNYKEFNTLVSEMKSLGYKKTDHTISKITATIIGILLSFSIAFALGFLYRPLYFKKFPDFEIDAPTTLILTLITLVSLIFHELLHGLGWSLFCKNGWKSIKISWSIVMPTCHCKEPLPTRYYLFGLLLPSFVLGFCVLNFSFVFLNIYIVISAMINIIIAGGDMLIALLLIKSKNSTIIDHPTAPGFIAFHKN